MDLVRGYWTGCDDPVTCMEQRCAILHGNNLQWNRECDTCRPRVVCPESTNGARQSEDMCSKGFLCSQLCISVHFHISPLTFQLHELLPTQTCREFISLSQFLALFLLFPLKEFEFLDFCQGIKHLFYNAVTISEPTWFIWKEWWP